MEQLFHGLTRRKHTEGFQAMCQVYCSEVTKGCQKRAQFPPLMCPNICVIYPLHQDVLNQSKYARISSLGAEYRHSRQHFVYPQNCTISSQQHYLFYLFYPSLGLFLFSENYSQEPVPALQEMPSQKNRPQHDSATSKCIPITLA